MRRIQSEANFVRYEIGELLAVALRDGHVDMPPSRLRQQGDRPFGAELPEQVRLVDGQLRLSVNAFLVIEPGRHVLIDTGAADAWLPTMAASGSPAVRQGRKAGEVPSEMQALRGRLRPARDQTFSPSTQACKRNPARPARPRLPRRTPSGSGPRQEG